MNCPPDTDTPGFAIENQTKPEETHLLSETAGLYSPSSVARYFDSIYQMSLNLIKGIFWKLKSQTYSIIRLHFRQLVEDTLEGKFLSTSGFDGWILTSLCSAMTNTSFKEAITQSFLIGLFRFGTWFTVKNFYRIIHNCHRKRNEGKKKA